MGKYHFFAFLSRMKYITRWGLMRNLQKENLNQHSMETAMLAHALCVISNTYFGGSLNCERAAVLALFHDCSEIITGDLPTPVKYYSPNIKTAYSEIENDAKMRILSMLPDKMQPTYNSLFFKSNEDSLVFTMVKAADKLSAYIKCIEEMKTGNSEFKEAGESIKKQLREMKLPEVDFFMENFIESYGLTLDEQNK
ncbi:MAG: 5'-deoxynucleotidase [Lachnospiraceae bacterium]|nr:5'-deoxynucleotidase [Lachnospiraceae bacterium]